MVNDYFLGLAQQASEICGIDYRWIYSQWVHESTNVDTGVPFESELAIDNHNLAGLTQFEDNGCPQPDGRFYYINFPTYEAYANYFGRYIKKYYPETLSAQTIPEYAEALKNGQYFGDTLENYISGMENAFKEAFENGM